MTQEQGFWIISTYLVASIPYSVWIGRLNGVDIRAFGDGNPGATNVKRATGSPFWFLIALLCDGAKGLFPVGIPFWLSGWPAHIIILIAISALLGHAFPVFMRFRGGKAIATTFGVWIGLMLFEGSLVMGILLTYWFMVVRPSDWVVLCWWLSYGSYLLLVYGFHLVFIPVWALNLLILLYRHQAGLRHLPLLRRNRDKANPVEHQAAHS